MSAKKSLFGPRWSKILADLWADRTRSLLVVASIAVGVFAIGSIVTTYAIYSEDVSVSYASAQPANIVVITDPFDDTLVRSVADMPGVITAEGRIPVGAEIPGEILVICQEHLVFASV